MTHAAGTQGCLGTELCPALTGADDGCATLQQCQAAMKRAQALKEKMENQNPNAAQPSPLRLPALQIPVNREASPEGLADQSPDNEPGAGSSAAENTRLSPPSSPTGTPDQTGGLSQAAGSGGDSQPSSPGRQLAGDSSHALPRDAPS